MPDRPKIINFDDARRKQRGDQQTLAALMIWIEELEDALETMTKSGLTTRAELEHLIADLEAQVPTDPE